jgi:hypothetical protein
MVNSWVDEEYPWLRRAFELAKEAGEEPPEIWLGYMEAINNDWLAFLRFQEKWQKKAETESST